MGEKFFTINRKNEKGRYTGPCRTFLKVPVYLNGKETPPIKTPPIYFGPGNQVLLNPQGILFREPEIITVPSRHQPSMDRIYSIDEAILQSDKRTNKFTGRPVTLYRQDLSKETKPGFSDITLTFYNQLINKFAEKSGISPEELMKIPISIFDPENIIRVNAVEQAKVYQVMQNLGALGTKPGPVYA